MSLLQLLRYVKESDARTFLIGTEEGLLHGLRGENPDKAFPLLTTSLMCPDMKKTTLKSVVRTMEERRNMVRVAEEVRVEAKLALDRMLEVT